MIAITTSNSMRVKARSAVERVGLGEERGCFIT